MKSPTFNGTSRDPSHLPWFGSMLTNLLGSPLEAHAARVSSHTQFEATRRAEMRCVVGLGIAETQPPRGISRMIGHAVTRARTT
jgi:hypothetical protein